MSGFVFLRSSKFRWDGVLGTLVQSSHTPPSFRSKEVLAAVSGGRPGLNSGRFADRFGNTRIILCGFAMLLGLVPLLLWMDNPVAALLVLIPIGFAMMATYAPSVVLGQKYLPNHIGFASGITLGIAVAAGGIAAPFLGRIADTYGLVTVFSGLAILPLLNILITYFLPEPSNPKQS